MSNIVQITFQFPERASDAYNQLSTIDAEIKRLESMKKSIRGFLVKSINVEENPEKPGQMIGSADGVQRLSYSSERVSWKEACEKIIEELVPKTRHSDAHDIIDANRKVVWADKFKLEDSGDADFEV